MQRRIFTILTLMSLLTLECLADDFSKDVAGLIEELSGKMKWESYPVAVGLGNFFYADSKISSEFGYHFASEVGVVVTDMTQFKLVARSRLDEILNELGLQVSDLVDPNTTKEIGKIQGLDAMITGGYSAWGKEVRVSADLIRIEDAVTVTANRMIGDVPKNVEIKPPDYEIQKQRIDEKIQNWFSNEPVTGGSGTEEQGSSRESGAGFNVTIEPERREAYKEGDELKLYVKSNRDCYIEILDISPDGSTQQIFPNEYWLRNNPSGDNYIKANVRTPIPPDSSFSMMISPPYGVETLKVVASTRPFVARSRSIYQERGAFPVLGNIDDPQTMDILKQRYQPVLRGPDSPQESAQFSENYCTILTESGN